MRILLRRLGCLKLMDGPADDDGDKPKLGSDRLPLPVDIGEREDN